MSSRPSGDDATRTSLALIAVCKVLGDDGTQRLQAAGSEPRLSAAQ
jgi:hypothetical protein